MLKRRKYLISVSVTKGDHRATAIRAMAGNLQISTDYLEVAEQRVERLMVLISAIKPGKFDSYGVINIVNESAGKVMASEHIGSGWDDSHNTPAWDTFRHSRQVMDSDHEAALSQYTKDHNASK